MKPIDVQPIKKGITHCDTIGDLFKNPLLINLIKGYHKEMFDGKNFTVQSTIEGKKSFTPYFYEFIRAIFSEKTEIDRFLMYVREIILLNPKKKAKLDTYSIEMKVNTLLSFREILHTLVNIEVSTIGNIFKLQIIDVLNAGYSEDVEYAESEQSVYEALICTLGEEIFPISNLGKIIYKVDTGDTGHIVHSLGEDFKTGEIEVDIFGNNLHDGTELISIQGEETLDTREKIIQKIISLENILSYHNDTNEGIDLSEEDEMIYIDMQMEHEKKATSSSDISVDELDHFRFGKKIHETKADLEKLLKKLKPSDTTQIKKWDKKGLRAGARSKLPTDINGNKKNIIKKVPLTIVNNKK